MPGDQADCTSEVLELYTTLNVEIDPFEWSEGLALAAEDLVTKWLDTDKQSLQQDDGSSTWSRVQKYGIVGGHIAEYAIWFDAGAGNEMDIGPKDCVLAMLIGDGDPDKVARNAILDLDGDDELFYNKLGAAVGTTDDNRFVVCDIIFANTYSTFADVPSCGVEANFGGGPCDPSVSDMTLFYWINWLRLHPDDETINDELEAILDSFDEFGTISVFDYDGNGVDDMRGYSADGEANVSAAI